VDYRKSLAIILEEKYTPATAAEMKTLFDLNDLNMTSPEVALERLAVKYHYVWTEDTRDAQLAAQLPAVLAEIYS
jgi:hypothetical protein